MIYTPVSPLLKYEIKNMEYNIPAVFQGRFDTRMPNLLQNGKSENEKNDNSNNDSDKVLGTIGALCLGALVIGGIMMKKRLPEHHIALSMDKPKSFMVNAYDSKDCAERVIREMEAKRAYAVEQINAAFKSTSESAKQTAKKAKEITDEILDIIKKGKKTDYADIKTSKGPLIEFLKDETGKLSGIYEYSDDGKIIRTSAIKNIETLDIDILDDREKIELLVRKKIPRLYKKGEVIYEDGSGAIEEMLSFDINGKTEKHLLGVSVSKTGRTSRIEKEALFKNGRVRNIKYGQDCFESSFGECRLQYTTDGKGSITISGNNPETSTGTTLKIINGKLGSYSSTTTAGGNPEILSCEAVFDANGKIIEYNQRHNRTISKRYIYDGGGLVRTERNVQQNGEYNDIEEYVLYDNFGNPMQYGQDIRYDSKGQRVCADIYDITKIKNGMQQIEGDFSSRQSA